jgi:hypothetical protein
MKVSQGLCGVVVLSALIVAGCASDKEKGVKLTIEDCYYPYSKVEAPGWVCDQPVEGIEVSAVGSARKTAAGLDFMKDQAATSARVQLAKTLKVRVSSLVKQYAEVSGGATESVDAASSSLNKVITDQNLSGSKLYRTAIGPDGTLYALVGLDAKAAKAYTEEVLRTSMKQEKSAWVGLRNNTQQSEDELAKAIAENRQK